MGRVGKLISILFIILFAIFIVAGIILYFGAIAIILIFIFVLYIIISLLLGGSYDPWAVPNIERRNPRSIYYELLRLYKTVWKRTHNANWVPNRVYKKMRKDARRIAYSMNQFCIAGEVHRLRAELSELKRQQ